MSRIVYVNGAYVPEQEAKVSVFDRGFLFGDGVYEVIPVLNSRLVESAHAVARIDRSLGEIGMAWPCTKEEYFAYPRRVARTQQCGRRLCLYAGDPWCRRSGLRLPG